MTEAKVTITRADDGPMLLCRCCERGMTAGGWRCYECADAGCGVLTDACIRDKPGLQAQVRSLRRGYYQRGGAKAL